ncbi:ABC transporter substrate-binding protein [Aeromonas veronii]|nr:ABC transporter substrate-binding protein [Aeromonas veronii]
MSAVAIASFGAQAKEISVISFGGANKDAQAKAYYQPFTKESGVNVIAGEYNGEMAKLKAMVETKSVSWDVVEVESSEVTRGCDEGFFEKLDYKVVGKKSELISGAASKCGVGFFVYSTVFAYNSKKVTTAPTSWTDFWDVKKNPGKRGMRKTAKYTLEAALLADGVAAKDIYSVLATPAGVDRAFKKLDELKPNIQWWEAGAQAPQYLISGDVVMSAAYNGRITNARNEGNTDLEIVWNGGLYEMEYWVIPKGTPNKDEAMKFIASTLLPERQVAYSKLIPYGPTRKSANTLVSAELASVLPSSEQNIKKAAAIDPAFWLDHGEELERRFNAWAAK